MRERKRKRKHKRNCWYETDFKDKPKQRSESEQGVIKGLTKAKRQVAVNLLKSNMDVNLIAATTELPINQVKALKALRLKQDSKEVDLLR